MKCYLLMWSTDRGVNKGNFWGCQPQFADKEDVQTIMADKEGFPCVPTSASPIGIPQICRQAKYLLQICRQVKFLGVWHPTSPRYGYALEYRFKEPILHIFLHQFKCNVPVHLQILPSNESSISFSVFPFESLASMLE